MKRLDRYILQSYILSFVFAIGILAMVSLVVDYSQKVDAFVKRKAPTGEILIYFMNFIPHIVALLYPLFIFVSTIFFTSKLAYRSEIIAMQSSGMSFKRVLKPYLIGAVIIGLVSLVFNHFIVPIATRNANDFTDKYVYDRVTSSDENLHLRISPNKYIYFQNFDLNSNIGYQFTEETFDGVLLKRKIFADQIIYNDSTNEWTLKYVSIRTNDGLRETLTRLPELKQKYQVHPSELVINPEHQSTMTTPTLMAKINTEKTRGSEQTNVFEYELHRRTSDAAAGIILTVIAASIASKKVRGGSGLHLAIGIVLSALFLLFAQFSKTFSINSGLYAILAAWIPNIIFSIIAFILYRRRSG